MTEETIMGLDELDQVRKRIEAISEHIPCKIRVTMLKAGDCERQLSCPNFKIYVSGSGSDLDKSCSTLVDICIENGWNYKRIGHRDFIVDINPSWTRAGKNTSA